jgi:hypothetical protein
MAEGLGQHHGDFSSPDFEGLGVATWSEMTGVEADDPYVAGPHVGGFAPDPMGSTGLTRVGTGGMHAEEHPMHWSELLNWRDSPLPYWLGLALLVFGFASLNVHARLGK